MFFLVIRTTACSVSSRKETELIEELERFLDEPGDELPNWRRLWELDQTLRLRSHRPFLGRLIVGIKRILRPLVKAPQADLWERQRLFNLVLIAHVESLRQNVSSLSEDLEQVSKEILGDLRQVRDDLVRDLDKNHQRISHLEDFKRDGLRDLMDHSDALYSLIDQRLDRVRREIEPLRNELSEIHQSLAISDKS